jgi:hypothetical protein
VCLARAGLNKAVVDATRLPSGEVRTRVYHRAVEAFNAHHCTPIPARDGSAEPATGRDRTQGAPEREVPSAGPIVPEDIDREIDRMLAAHQRRNSGADMMAEFESRRAWLKVMIERYRTQSTTNEVRSHGSR